jgi:hypothetical protein
MKTAMMQEGHEAYWMKIEYAGAWCNNVGRQCCTGFWTWIRS